MTVISEEDGIDEFGHGGLSFCARDTDDGDLARGEAVPHRTEKCEKIVVCGAKCEKQSARNQAFEVVEK